LLLLAVEGGKKKQFGKIKPQPAPTGSQWESLAGLDRGHPARLIQDRIDAITKEIRSVASEALWDAWGKRNQGSLFAGHTEEEVREGDSTGPGNDERTS
jgi:hypothetical protein